MEIALKYLYAVCMVIVAIVSLYFLTVAIFPDFYVRRGLYSAGYDPIAHCLVIPLWIAVFWVNARGLRKIFSRKSRGDRSGG